jgi:signal peptidase I
MGLRLVRHASLVVRLDQVPVFQEMLLYNWFRCLAFSLSYMGQLGAMRTFVYNGPSMAPTFRPGHLLYVRPEIKNPVPGDVVVFSDISQGGLVVHRVVVVTPTGLVTRGDHNLQCDGFPVPYRQVIGRVDASNYGGVIRSVAGGTQGLLAARVRWVALGGWVKLRYILGAPYRAVKNSPLMRRWLKRTFKLRMDFITFQTLKGPSIKALHHGRVVARWEPALKRFECIKPYDLWLEESDLPLVKSKNNPRQF